MKYESGEYKIILDYLRDCGGWVLAGKVRSIQTPYGFIGFRGDRNCRDLVRAGKLEKDESRKDMRWVRFKPQNIAEIGGKSVKIFEQPAPKKTKEQSKLL